MRKTLVEIVVPVAILVAGVAGFALMRSMGEPPARVERPYRGPLVEAVELPAVRTVVVIDGQGTVRSGAQIDLVPQVSGVVVWKSDSLEPGGIFAAGDLLLRIDPRDAQLAVKQAESAVAQSRYRLELARQESEVARQEWMRLREGGEEPTALVLHLPQLRAAEADLQAAEARLAEARLRLERTRMYAPFAGRVRSNRVEVGQYFSAGQPVAQIYSIEKAEVVVPVPDEDLAWLAVPAPVPEGAGEPVAAPAERREVASLFAKEGADASVRATFAGNHHEWHGRVVRTEGEIDPQSRMVRLVIEVENPYAGVAEGKAPLTVGMFVDVAIKGRPVDDVRILPRGALRQGDRVWIVTPGDIVRVRGVRILRAMKDEVLARFDMAADERVVVSQLSGVTDGMKVRVAGEEMDS